MSGKGYGARDSVQAPLTLITAFGRLARSSTFGRSAHGCGGAGGVRGCMMARWSMMNRASGWRSISAAPASKLTQHSILFFFFKQKTAYEMLDTQIVEQLLLRPHDVTDSI